MSHPLFLAKRLVWSWLRVSPLWSCKYFKIKKSLQSPQWSSEPTVINQTSGRVQKLIWKPQNWARDSANYGDTSRDECMEGGDISRLTPGGVVSLMSVFSLLRWVSMGVRIWDQPVSCTAQYRMPNKYILDFLESWMP